MNNFNLKKFLVENKITTNSRMLKEEVVNLNTVELGGEVWTVGEPDPIYDGIVTSISRHKEGFFVTYVDDDYERGYGLDLRGYVIDGVDSPEELETNWDE